MKKFILKTLTASLILLIISTSISFLLEKYRYSDPFFNIPTTTNKIIIGSSRAYHNLLIEDPTIWNLTKPNLYLSDTYNIFERISIPNHIDSIYVELQDVNYSTDKNQKYFDGPSHVFKLFHSPLKEKSLFLENALMNYSYSTSNLSSLFPPKPIILGEDKHDYGAMREKTDEREIIKFLKDSLYQNSKAFYGLSDEKISYSLDVAEVISKKLRVSNPNLELIFFVSFGTFYQCPKTIDQRTVIDLRENLELQENDIYDYRHLTLPGAKKMTKDFYVRTKPPTY